MEFNIQMTDNTNIDFVKLTKMLDLDLVNRYGDLQKQYDKHNKVDHIRDVVLIYADKIPAACGAFKRYDSSTVEIKRIFVREEFRRLGLSKILMKKLEESALSQGYKYALLETGHEQPEAVNLYQNMGYEVMPNYEPYVGLESSVCMKKIL